MLILGDPGPCRREAAALRWWIGVRLEAATSGARCASVAFGGDKKAEPVLLGRVPYEKVAATYFPAFYCSIIGAVGLNFSVRDGKRWTPTL